jgi:AcrR family transcriptional regulator
MTTFRRAHSPQQREVRRRAILDAAAAMLGEMSVSEISLNELGRRAGMAKSNVLRYFESREAVLLELLSAQMNAWIDQVALSLADIADPSSPATVRSQQLVDVLVTTLVGHPVLCDLMSEQAAVLERNISGEAVLQHKHASIAGIERLMEIVRRQLPELGAEGTVRFTTLAALLTTAVWPHSNPPAALAALYRDRPELACYRVEFESTLRESLHIVLAGLLASQQ